MYRISDNLIFKIEKLQVSGLDSVCVRNLDQNKKTSIRHLIRQPIIKKKKEENSEIQINHFFHVEYCLICSSQ